ncbi:cellulase-like family protein [Streptomyces sp. NPDC127098]|uniref:cellulase-like family protein n=1 Tax=Streptomyces sp. NPDC127098 TaxID=3347137 RepID=UPI003651E9D0
MTYTPVPLPRHLPDRLTITLWDFSWYTRTGPGEPFEDLDRAFTEAVERGYNTIRICAMPYLVFGSGLSGETEFGPLGGEYGQGTRWYDIRHRVRLDPRAQLLALLRAAKRHGVVVILSSWEYQQSSSFAGDRRWFDALMAVAPEDRPVRLADALADACELAAAEGLAEVIAFVELHNEVQGGYLTEGLPGREPAVVELRERLERGLARFHERQPDVPVTVNYARVPLDAFRGIPENIDVGVFHPYVYGVLDELVLGYGLRSTDGGFDEERARADLMRPGAPTFDQWRPPAGEEWRLEATIVGKPEIYVHDWCDAEAWDRFLYERYGEHRASMLRTLETWISAAADLCAGRGIPLVFGEGWIGYTPLSGNFEEGPVGAEFCRQAVRLSARVGAWGTIVCSNAAPHHPMWSDIALQRECNGVFSAAEASPGRS